LAPTFLSEDEIPASPTEPTAETSAPSIPPVTEPVIMRLSHDLANDQAVQLSILQAQTARSLASSQDTATSSLSNVQPGQHGDLYVAGVHTSTYTPPSQHVVPPSVAGADLNSLLAQLSGSGLAASLNTATPPVPPHMQHHQPPSHQYSHLQQYSQ